MDAKARQRGYRAMIAFDSLSESISETDWYFVVRKLLESVRSRSLPPSP
jgi:hypothetical protein